MVLRQAVVAIAVAGIASCGDEGPGSGQFSIDRAHPRVGASADASASSADDDAVQDALGGDSYMPEDTLPPLDTRPSGPEDASADADARPPSDGDIAPAADAQTPPSLQVAALAKLPVVAAGAGSASTQLLVVNTGGAGALEAQLSGSASLSLGFVPTTLGAGESTSITLSFAGASTPTTAEARLVLSAGGRDYRIDVVAIAIDPLIGSALWQPVYNVDTYTGDGTTVSLPTAPYPAVGGDWSDDSVLIFVPEGLRERGAVDFVVHFHGFGTVVGETEFEHDYREQLYLSGVNAALVIPQGPVNAASGDFGKLMHPGGLADLLEDVTHVLYRDGWVDRPVVGDITLTAHSGGYQAVAQNLNATTGAGLITHAHLFDGLYGRESDFVTFVGDGGRLRSNYTASGGTSDDNLATADLLGTAAAEQPSARNLRDAAAVLWFVDTTHANAARFEQAYAETLRWGAPRSRRGPRLAIRSATALGADARISWLSPRDDDVVGFDVEASVDGLQWQVVTDVGSDADSATFALHGPRRVRVVPVTDGVPATEAMPSDAYFVSPQPRVAIVDGFDRRLGGSFGAIRHDFVARVGAAVDTGVTSFSNEALVQDDASLAGFDTVIWLLGDESTDDHTFTAAEQGIVDAYLQAGGSLVVSGSEVGWDLGARGNGVAFLAGLGAAYAGDDSGSYTVSGAGALAGVIPAFSYGGAGAAYEEDFPDHFTATGGGEVVLSYGNGKAAAVGIAGRSVVVGFPLELVDDGAHLASLLEGLLDFVSP